MVGGRKKKTKGREELHNRLVVGEREGEISFIACFLEKTATGTNKQTSK